MDRLIYTAVSGMSDSMVRERVIASNMANTSTIGFKAEKLFTMPVTLKGPALEARVMADGQVKSADMSAGNITPTGRKLDIAMLGDAMLAVQSADGTESYTRRGDLTVSPTGVLENGDGRPVIGNGGPITLPLDAQVSIGPDGMVLVANPDNPSLPPQPIDRIKLASASGSTTAKGLDGLFRVVGGGALPADENARVIPGSLEQSNVNPSEVLTQMIQAQRLYDIRTKLIATAKEVDQSGTSLLRISGS
ncbi:flagellar basal body rod protein FlgF [Novosphingobium sp. KACC 22771]|uniref:flagellar basal body rod protein FlgF n=1 Tax=Novosphingobium sp. KACC 22771 TaxID=3025670 RepID=UPI0023657B16|nr:flagellar basal body rod protein FlgF [Novosphingobium sp. KACC 22771]WDF73275.1 flagellar basal body rod protein FlgF [Novosphingobium sp. KACC 22771]